MRYSSLTRIAANPHPEVGRAVHDLKEDAQLHSLSVVLGGVAGAAGPASTPYATRGRRRTRRLGRAGRSQRTSGTSHLCSTTGMLSVVAPRQDEEVVPPT